MSVPFSRRGVAFIVWSFAVTCVILISESFEPEVAITAHSNSDLNDKNNLVMQTNLKSVLILEPFCPRKQDRLHCSPRNSNDNIS